MTYDMSLHTDGRADLRFVPCEVRQEDVFHFYDAWRLWLRGEEEDIASSGIKECCFKNECPTLQGRAGCTERETCLRKINMTRPNPRNEPQDYGAPYLKGCFRPSVISAYDTWFGGFPSRGDTY